MKKYTAEFFGTLVLSLIVILSVSGVALKTTPVLAAITLGLFVYTIGSVSGCHINPAVTFGLWVLGKIKQNEAISYIAAQVIGAMSAVGIAWVLVEDLSRKISVIQNRVGNDPMIGLAEVLGAVIFGFGIMAVVSGKVKQELSGVVIGGSLFLGLLIAGSVSNGILYDRAVYWCGTGYENISLFVLRKRKNQVTITIKIFKRYVFWLPQSSMIQPENL